MSDNNLRDRIAAVVHQYSVPIPMAELVADAVIRELSLMIDDSYRIGYGNAFIVHGYYEVRDSR